LAKDFFLLPRCYLPLFSIISRNIKNVFFPFCFKRLKNTAKTSHSLSDEKAILQKITLLEDQCLKHRRKTGFPDKQKTLLKTLCFIFLTSFPTATSSIPPSGESEYDREDPYRKTVFRASSVCSQNPAETLVLHWSVSTNPTGIL